MDNTNETTSNANYFNGYNGEEPTINPDLNITMSTNSSHKNVYNVINTQTPDEQCLEGHTARGPNIPPTYTTTSNQSHSNQISNKSPFIFLDKHQGIKLCQHNVRSLPSKLDHIRLSLEGQPLDILSVNETWLDNSIRNSDIHIPGYTIERNDRSREGGGVACYIKETIKYKLRKDLTHPHLEALWLEIKPSKSHKNILIGSIYRPPSANAQYMEDLINVIDTINQDTTEIILLGDFNINFEPNVIQNNQVGDICHLFDMEQLIENPTRVTTTSSSTIDLILTTNRKLHVKTGTINYNISDHYPIYTVLLAQNSPKSIPRQFKLRDFKHFNQDNFLGELNYVLTNTMNTSISNDVDTTWNAFKSSFNKVCHTHAPLKEIRVKERNNPWMNNSILEAQYKRDHLHKLSVQTKDNDIFQKYRYMRNLVTSMIKRAQREYYDSELQKSKNDSRKMWATLKHLTNKRRHAFIPPDLTAQQFNKYFVNIGKSLGSKFDDETIPEWEDNHTINAPNTFKITTINIASTSKYIKKLPDRSNLDLLYMDSKLLRISADIIAPFVTKMFNLSITSGKVPSDWKIARVTPVYKNKGSHSDICNYRPISVVTHLSKLLESCIQTQLMDYLEDNKLITPDQSAFMRKHSTQTSLHKLMDDIITSKDNNKNVLMCFLDIQKCFDTINHKLLLTKLKRYGIKDNSLDWFSSYLTNRKQTVTCNGSLSPLLDISIGIPQGSGLGPVLFLLFINDLPQISDKFSFNLYADDTVIYKAADKIEDLCVQFNDDIGIISNWYSSNKLTLNATKTEFLILGPNKNRAPNEITFEKENIPTSNTVKYLGIKIDSNLNWNEQIKYIESKIKPYIHILNRLRHILDQKHLLTIYNTIIEPTIHYCDTVWGYCSKTNINRMNRLKRRCARAITNNYDWDIPGESLMSTLNIHQFEQKRNYHTACLTFKVINNLSAPYLSDKLSNINHGHHTRATASHNLLLPFPKHEFAKQTFSYTASKCWNKLPLNIKTTQTFTSFKHKYKQMKPNQ